MNLKKRYKWYREPDGEYAILDVEILDVYDDRRKTAGGEMVYGRGKADLSDLSAAVNNFEEQRILGHYPRVFVGHHESMENRPGVGFLDRLRLRGDQIIADIVCIPAHKFQEIKSGRYPYRSPEYVPQIQRITGLALLESQHPFFISPMLFLEENPTETVEKLEPALFSFRERKKFMEEKPENQPENQPEIPTDQGVPGEFDLQRMISEMKEDISDCKLMSERVAHIESMLMTLFEERDEDEDEDEEFGEEEDYEDYDMGKNPSSVAYQAKIKRLEGRLEKLETDKSEDSIMAELHRFCAVSGRSYTNELARIQKFQGDANKRAYLEALKSQGSVLTGFPTHEMSEQLARFQGMPVNKEEEVIQKFSREGKGTVARKALESYRDTISQKNRKQAQKFAAAWGANIETAPYAGLERFISHCCEMNEVDPHYLDKMCSV